MAFLSVQISAALSATKTDIRKIKINAHAHTMTYLFITLGRSAGDADIKQEILCVFCWAQEVVIDLKSI